MILLLLILFGILGFIVWFLAKEALKKFRFLITFAVHNPNHCTLWKSTESKTTERGMRNILLQADRPFIALVGFLFEIPIVGYEGLDIYGCVVSDSYGQVVISTYLGRNPTHFVFISNTNIKENPITISSSLYDQSLTPMVIYPPHFWQRLGIFS